MKNLLIIGAGGYGRVIYNHAVSCSGYNTEYRIKGFLDDRTDALHGYKNYPAIISSVEQYTRQQNDVFICAQGSIAAKKKYAQIIMSRGGEFISLMHPTAHIDRNTRIGKGCIIGAGAFIGCDGIIGDFVTVQTHAVIGHDSKIGNYSHVDPFVFLGGYTEAAEEVTLYPGAIVLPKKKIGKGAIIGAGSVVIRNVQGNTTVFGNPAAKL